MYVVNSDWRERAGLGPRRHGEEDGCENREGLFERYLGQCGVQGGGGASDSIQAGFAPSEQVTNSIVEKPLMCG